MQVTFFFRIRTTLLVAKQQIFMICVPWIFAKKNSIQTQLTRQVCKERKKVQHNKT